MESGKGANAISINFDITHGVNFMPLAAYRALRVACRVISATYGLKVEFKQYNSTPYPTPTKTKNPNPSSEHVPDLEVFIVKEETITPVKAAQRLVYSYLSRDEIKLFRFPKGFEDKVTHEIGKLQKEFNRIHRNAKALASSIHYSMPLAFIQFSKENEKYAMKMEEYVKGIEKLIEESLLNVNITKMDRKIRVEHRIAPSYEDLKSLLSALSLISYGNNSIKNLNKIKFQNRIIEAPLSELKNALKYLQGPLAQVANHEISNFKRGRFTSEELKEIVKQAKENRGNWKSYTGECEEVKRIMIAHAGLASKSIEVMFNNEILIRYRKECLKKTREIVGKALKETRDMIRGESQT
jgi:CRISPR-associated protein Csx1